VIGVPAESSTGRGLLGPRSRSSLHHRPPEVGHSVTTPVGWPGIVVDLVYITAASSCIPYSFPFSLSFLPPFFFHKFSSTFYAGVCFPQPLLFAPCRPCRRPPPGGGPRAKTPRGLFVWSGRPSLLSGLRRSFTRLYHDNLRSAVRYARPLSASHLRFSSFPSSLPFSSSRYFPLPSSVYRGPALLALLFPVLVLLAIWSVGYHTPSTSFPSLLPRSGRSRRKPTERPRSCWGFRGLIPFTSVSSFCRF